MNTLPFSIGAYNPGNNTATGFCRKKLYTCKSSAVNLQIQRSTTASASVSRREASVGLGFCFSFLQFLNPQQDSAEAHEVTSPSCEFAAGSSGLEYCDKVIGTGPEPVEGQLIKAHYVGKLDNGKVFDSSYDRGKPLTFRVGVGEVM
ncbi:peptidyl-prolyl cis-trans isomerase FKBP13, chloroplastic-like [Primulina tabacum]|uniref:peptidyl-prolyl cis-trans isomerase FKBP13, chloroplastic-like n=1 Tax=Primulina tabacum TaxID=48773 RepID=UPI003F5A7193